MDNWLIAQIQGICQAKHVLVSPEERWGYAYDATDRAHMPDLVAFPEIGRASCRERV